MLLSTTPPRRRATLFSSFVFLLLIVLLGLWLAFSALAATSPSTMPPEVITLQAQRFAIGLVAPVKVTNAGDSRLFVVEQAGRIRIVQSDGTVLATPFLDIQGRVNNSGNEQGLLGLVFEPDDPTVFYVNYTVESTDSARNGDTIIARYRVSTADPNRADPASEEIILEVDQPYENHNAGDLAFGPDGYLYVPLGDGGSGGDPDENAQDLSKLLGKLLRIDVVGKPTYTIPATNPYVNDGDPNTRGEIWAAGLRNPWRISFDRLTNDLYIADVGQFAWEEINLQSASSSGGENYGWDCREGNHDFEPAGCTGTYTAPIFEYSHTENQTNPPAGCSSVTGGYVYRGAAYPALQGHYLLADYCSGKFWTLAFSTTNGWTATAHGRIVDNPASFGEDQNGELYVVSRSGTIFRLLASSQASPTPTLLPTTVPLTEKFYLPIVGKDGNN